MNGDSPTALHTDDTASDRQVVVAFMSGDPDAFADLYRHYVRRIHDFLRRTVHDRQAAEDLTQSVFLQAYERRSTLREPEAFRAWLYRIAHNAAINYVTRTRSAESLDEEAAWPSIEPEPEHVVQERESVDLVWDAAAALEPRQYAVLDLTVRKGLTTSEVAEVLGVDAAQASVAVFRAREALGNAVRFLLVARNRRHCERLAELVPEGLRQLTPAQRMTVDRHLRRCPICRDMALLLTSSENILAATPLLLIPTTLHAPPPLAPATIGSVHAAGHVRWLAHRLSRLLLLAGTTVGAAGVVAVLMVIRHPASPTTLRAGTSVVTYEPWAVNQTSGEAVPREDLKVTTATGTCDGGSAADPGRTSAFRCFLRNVIQDACFAPSPMALPAPAVLCVNDPTSAQVHLVSLTAPLPTTQRNSEDPGAMPWFLILADGRHCARLSGGTDTAVLRYQCTNGTQVTEPDKSGQLWIVHDGHYVNERPVV